MGSDELALMSAVDLAAGYRARRFSPVEVIDAVLARVDRVNPTFNLTMQPAATVPCGLTADGLPVGLQIVGRRLADPMVLAASAAFEAAQPWRGRRPPLD